jgi:hypothetical protein
MMYQSGGEEMARVGNFVVGILWAIAILAGVAFVCVTVCAGAEVVTEAGSLEVAGDYVLGADIVGNLDLWGGVHLDGNGGGVSGRVRILGDNCSITNMVMESNGTALHIGEAGRPVSGVGIHSCVISGRDIGADQLVWLMGADNVVIEDCWISLDGGESREVIQFQGCEGVRISRTSVIAAGRNKISIRSGSRGVTFEECDILMGGTGIQITAGGGHLISHCRIEAGEVGVYFRSGSEASEVRNGLIIAPTGVSWHREARAGDWQILSNTIVGDIAKLEKTLAVTLRNNIVTGRRIGSGLRQEANWVVGDDGAVGFMDGYRLGASSPAVDAGMPGWVTWSEDLAGDPRLNGNPDLGAFEYQGGYVPPPDDPPPPPPIDPPTDPPVVCPDDVIELGIRMVWDGERWVAEIN